MIHLPFEDRIILLGGRWQNGLPEHIKEYMHRIVSVAKKRLRN